MKHILIFESFLELNEINYTGHWKERTSLSNFAQSRAVPYSVNSMYGYRLLGFFDQSGNYLNFKDGRDLLNISEKDLDNYVSKSINAVTNSRKLEKYYSDSNKSYLLLDLGRICFDNGENKLYPVIKSGRGFETPGFYDKGDRIWGYVNDFSEGVTIKYFMSDEEGTEKAFDSARMSSKNTSNIFNRNSSIEYPYGKNFEIVVDLTDNDPKNILKKIKDQTEGIKIEMGPVKKEDIPSISEPSYSAPDFKRAQISKGLIIAMVDAETGAKTLYEVVDDPKNADNLYQTYLEDKQNKTDLLKTSPVVFVAKKVKELISYIGSTPITKIVPTTSNTYQVTLNPGDKIYIKKAAKEVMGSKTDPNQLYRFKFITSEPSILKRGSVQIALELI